MYHMSRAQKAGQDAVKYMLGFTAPSAGQVLDTTLENL